MPYLTQTQKDNLDERREYAPAAFTAGELNYVITREVQKFLKITDPTDYATFNAAIGALECAKLELYRRMVAPYEDLKKNQNGDVYVH